jgi:hypothetical protein
MQYSKQRFVLALLGGTALPKSGAAAIPESQLSDAEVSSTEPVAVGAQQKPEAAESLDRGQANANFARALVEALPSEPSRDVRTAAPNTLNATR